ncbi:MAG: hypothetical protein M3Q07_00930 [Pseudobdellovibrionaceae bacterium]|nr:hypothetical protein [Pseudobdellovibrionaceae bacterium]
MKLATLLLSAACTASAAQAAWVVPNEGQVACTDDYNAWGKASSCSCPEATVYNMKIGQCLAGVPYPILVSGVLHSKNALKNGVSLETSYGTFQLVVKLAELEKLQRADQLYFEADGEFVLMPSAGKSAARPTILVENLSWLE